MREPRSERLESIQDKATLSSRGRERIPRLSVQFSAGGLLSDAYAAFIEGAPLLEEEGHVRDFALLAN